MSLVLALGAAAQPARPPAPMPTLPLTQLDDRGLASDLDARTFTLTFAQPVPIQELLLLLVRGTNISVVPDPAISGSFIGELKNVTVRQALGYVLRPLGLEYALDGSVVRVFRREAETRIFDVNYLAAQRTASSSIGAGEGAGRAVVSTSVGGDVFADLASGVRTLLSERGTFNVDRKAGLLQVSDLAERLDRVAIYLDAVHDRMLRQVQIDARVVEVEIDDEKGGGIDWNAVAASSTAAAAGSRPASRPSLNGLRVGDVETLLERLAAQGKVTVIASPRMLTLNNEPAVVHTDALAFSVTPQISGEAVVTLSLSPVIKAPVIEADMIARVADGETLVVSGLGGEHEVRERRNVGASGGWFGRGTVVTRKRVEVVILLTPKIVAGAAGQ